MVGKGQWVMLLYLVTQNLPGLRLSPPGVKEERDRLPGWLRNYSYSRLNCNTIPLTELLSVKYGRSLDCLLRKNNCESGPRIFLHVKV